MSDRPAKKASVRAKLILAVFTTLLTLGLLEIGARIWLDKLATREQFSKFASLEQYRKRIGGEEWWFGLLAPHRYLGYTLAPNLVDGKNRHNSMGFRGDEIVMPKPKGEFRIACLGASTTYSLLVPDYHRTYPALLEKALRQHGHPNLTVINTGVPAWSTYEMLINYLLKVQDLGPDLILIKEAFADLAGRMVWPPSAYKSDNSGCLAAQFAPREPPFYEASTLLRILMVETGRSLPTAALGHSVYNQASTAYFFEFARQRFGWAYPSGIFKTVPVGRMLAQNPPIYYRRNVENLVMAAKSRGVVPVIVTFPYTPQMPGYFDIAGFREGLDQHNGILRDIAKKLNAPLMDLAAVFPTEKSFWGFDGIHASEKGTELEAAIIAKFLIDQNLITQPSSQSP